MNSNPKVGCRPAEWWQRSSQVPFIDLISQRKYETGRYAMSYSLPDICHLRSTGAEIHRLQYSNSTVPAYPVGTVRCYSVNHCTSLYMTYTSRAR